MVALKQQWTAVPKQGVKIDRSRAQQKKYHNMSHPLSSLSRRNSIKSLSSPRKKHHSVNSSSSGPLFKFNGSNHSLKSTSSEKSMESTEGKKSEEFFVFDTEVEALSRASIDTNPYLSSSLDSLKKSNKKPSIKTRCLSLLSKLKPVNKPTTKD